MKVKILTGIRIRIERLEKQLEIATENGSKHIANDTLVTLDELYSLESWIEGLDDD